MHHLRKSQRNYVLNLLGRTATLTPEVEIESCPDYSRAFAFWNDVPILLLNHSISRNENPQGENEVDSSSFEDFHTQIASLLTVLKKSNTANTRVVYVVSCSKTKQNKTGMMKNIARLA